MQAIVTLPMRSFLLVFIWAFFHQGVFALVGDWQYHTYLDSVSALAHYNKSFYVGTSGGIREIDAKSLNETVYNGAKCGIWDVDIVGFAQSDKHGFWAVSRRGVLYHLLQSGEWAPTDRGLGISGWTVNPRAILLSGDYILLGTQKGLSFFHIPTGLVDFNISIFSSYGDVSVTALARKDDFLFVSTSKGVFKGEVYWPDFKNPPASYRSDYGTIFNPQLWAKVSDAESNAFLGWYNDVLQVFPLGQRQNSPRPVSAILGTPVIVNGKVYPQWQNTYMIADDGKTVLTANGNGVYIIQNDNLVKLTNANSLLGPQTLDLAASEWGVYIWQLGGIFGSISQISPKDNSKPAIRPHATHLQWVEPIVHRLPVFHITGKDSFYISAWGNGIYSHGPSTSRFFDVNNSCLDEFATDLAYTVTSTAVIHQNEGMFVSNYTLGKPYNLSYLRFKDQQMKCWNPSASGTTSKTVRKLTLVNDTVLLSATESGIESYKIQWSEDEMPSLNHWKHIIDTDENVVEILNAVVDRNGRLWATTAGRLFYEDNFLENESGGDTLFQAVSQFSGENCHHILQDANHNLWFGCRNGLFHLSTSPENPVGNIRAYTNRDGLLDNDIIQMDYRAETGEVWIVSEKGITRFETGATVLPQKVDKVDVYPNPFLVQHDAVIFDGLSEKADVLILNQTGDMIFNTSVDILNNGQYRWNGLSNFGHRPKPGIYYWVVKNKSSASKGKLVIGR